MKARLRRAALALLDLEDPTAERDWQGMEAELGELADKLRATEARRDEAEIHAAEWKASENRAREELAEERKLRRMETDKRVLAEKALRDATSVEHVSAIGALREALRVIDLLLPDPSNLIKDGDAHQTVPRTKLREIRNIITRGLQNDTVFMRTVVATMHAAHFRRALSRVNEEIAAAFAATDRMRMVDGERLVAAAAPFGIVPREGETPEAFRARVLSFFPHHDWSEEDRRSSTGES